MSIVGRFVARVSATIHALATGAAGQAAAKSGKAAEGNVVRMARDVNAVTTRTAEPAAAKVAFTINIPF